MYFFFQSSPENVIMNNNLLERKRFSLMNVRNWYLLPQLQWFGFDMKHRFDLKYIQSFINDIAKR